jgi:MFS family permease
LKILVLLIFTVLTIYVTEAIINAGSLAGGLFAGSLCDQYGLRSGIFASAIITLVAVAIQASAVHETAFCVGRFLLGASITANGTAAPV